jgi:hypothetical protein
MKYARIIGGYAIDVHEASSIAELEKRLGVTGFVQVPSTTQHGAKDNGDGTFTNPAGENSAGPKTYDPLDFTRRFTSAERQAIRAAAKTNTAVEDFVELLNIAAASGRRITITDPDVVAGVQAYEAAGLIGQGRAAEILS